MPAMRDLFQWFWEEVGLTGDLPGNSSVILSRLQTALGGLEQGKAATLQPQLELLAAKTRRLLVTGMDPDELFMTQFDVNDPLQTAELSAEVATRRARQLRDVGTPIRLTDRTPPQIISPQTAPIRPSQDLPPINAQYWREYRELATEADRAVADHLGDAYAFDPFFIQLGRLPREQQRDFQRRFARLQGLYDYLGRDIGPTQYDDSFFRYGVAGEEFRYGEKPDPRAFIYGRGSVRYFNEPLDAEGLAGRYMFSANIPRPQTIEHLQSIFAERKGFTGKSMVFDIETASLSADDGLRELAATLYDEEGNVVGDPLIAKFKNTKMRLGEFGPDSRRLDLVAAEFLEGEERWDSFKGSMTELFKMAEQADWIVGHNIAGFDIPVILQNARFPGYQRDEAYATALEAFQRKLFYYTPEGEYRIGTHVIDTHTLAYAALGDQIPIARELAARNRMTSFSLQNMLLETDLLDRIREIDPQLSAKIAAGRTHAADVDAPLTHHVDRILRQHITGERRLKFESLPPAFTLHGERARENIVRSTALTPWTNFVSEEDIPLGVRERARAAGLIEEGRIRLTPLEAMVDRGRRYDLPGEASPLFGPHPQGETFRGFRERIIAGDWSGLWDRLRNRFWEGPAAPQRSINELGFHAGWWGDYARNIFTRQGVLKKNAVIPTTDEWLAKIEELQRKGIPVAGQNWMERHFSTVLGQLGREGLTKQERLARQVFSGVAPMGRYIEATKVGTTRSGVLHAPMRILEEAEQFAGFRPGTAELLTREELRSGAVGEGVFTHAGIVRTSLNTPFERAQLLRPSVFPDLREQALMLEFATGKEQGQLERDRLLAYLESRGHVQGEELDKVRRALSVGGGSETYGGVQVGTLGGVFQDPATARRANLSLLEMQGLAADSARGNSIAVRLAYGGRDIPGASEGIYTYGTVIGSPLLNEGDLKALGASGRESARLYSEGIKYVDRGPFKFLMKQIAAGGADDEAVGVATNLMQKFFTFRKRAPLIALAGGAIAGGYYLYRHKKQQAVYDETFNPQPTEDDQWYQSYRSDMAAAGPAAALQQTYGRSNTLATANVVRTLDRNKVRHTQMGPNKYSHLFGGGYT